MAVGGETSSGVDWVDWEERRAMSSVLGGAGVTARLGGAASAAPSSHAARYYTGEGGVCLLASARSGALWLGSAGRGWALECVL